MIPNKKVTFKDIEVLMWTGKLKIRQKARRDFESHFWAIPVAELEVCKNLSSSSWSLTTFFDLLVSLIQNLRSILWSLTTFFNLLVSLSLYWKSFVMLDTTQENFEAYFRDQCEGAPSQIYLDDLFDEQVWIKTSENASLEEQKNSKSSKQAETLYLKEGPPPQIYSYDSRGGPYEKSKPKGKGFGSFKNADNSEPKNQSFNSLQKAQMPKNTGFAQKRLTIDYIGQLDQRLSNFRLNAVTVITKDLASADNLKYAPLMKFSFARIFRFAQKNVPHKWVSWGGASADATGRAKDFQSFARLLEKKQNSTTPGFYKEKKMPEKDFCLPKLNEQTNKKEEADEHTNKEKESDEQTKNSQDTKTTQDKAKKSKYQKDQKWKKKTDKSEKWWIDPINYSEFKHRLARLRDQFYKSSKQTEKFACCRDRISLFLLYFTGHRPSTLLSYKLKDIKTILEKKDSLPVYITDITKPEQTPVIFLISKEVIDEFFHGEIDLIQDYHFLKTIMTTEMKKKKSDSD